MLIKDLLGLLVFPCLVCFLVGFRLGHWYGERRMRKTVEVINGSCGEILKRAWETGYYEGREKAKD